MKKILILFYLTVLLSTSLLGSTDVVKAKEALSPEVKNMSIKTISQSKIDSIVQQSREVAKETKENNKHSNRQLIDDTNQLINYFLIEGDTGYFYEMTPDEEETLQVFDIESTVDTSNAQDNNFINTQDNELVNAQDNELVNAQDNDFINTQDNELVNAQEIGLFNVLSANYLPDGIGGRVKIAGNGNYITSTVTLPTTTQMGNTQTGIAYIYSGFSGMKSSGASIETDMGLQYSKNNNGTFKWKPYLKWSADNTFGFGTHLPSNNVVNDQNGFKMGSNVTMTIYRNVNGNTRLSQLGTAICSDVNCYSQKETFLTSIVEVAGTNVSSVTKWKLLATIAGSDSVKGKSYAKFTGVNVDGVTKTPVADGADYATITVGTGTATITVSNP
ncbi:protein of unknown function, YrpD [Fontibacillus panacisegetis]|uniref:Uncharacterized protein n=1 Tax=Fontibacillus panacisegetis TaxID=670482 RepID=A0A1G7GI03_9BACL|nr:YrpD family protein [Fontibacillus panacisegetis]SDE87788.1 protein of unknown function, YrpD [Fontibacillus panacisegetis]